MRFRSGASLDSSQVSDRRGRRATPVAVGGFGMCGVPTSLIAALLEQGTTDLETVSNNLGVDGFGLGTLLSAGRIRRTIGSVMSVSEPRGTCV